MMEKEVLLSKERKNNEQTEFAENNERKIEINILTR